ncbi:MAG: hypothetical protein AABO57_11835 [Acidobacteriota bacterium]
MKNVLLLVAVIGLGAGAWFLYQFLYQPANDPDKSNLILGGVFFLAALVCFAFFFFMKFRDEGDQDISITKF